MTTCMRAFEHLRFGPHHTPTPAGDYDRLATAAKINQLIVEKPVIVFSWSGCPFCKRAKALLSDVGANYTALELDTLPDGKAIRAELAQVG